jgi:hypothetical protein
MFIFNFYNNSEFLKEKENVLKIILPKLRKKLNELHKLQNTDEIQTEIQNKEIIIKSLKYYYTI